MTNFKFYSSDSPQTVKYQLKYSKTNQSTMTSFLSFTISKQKFMQLKNSIIKDEKICQSKSAFVKFYIELLSDFSLSFRKILEKSFVKFYEAPLTNFLLSFCQIFHRAFQNLVAELLFKILTEFLLSIQSKLFELFQ